MGSFICYALELGHMADAVELFFIKSTAQSYLKKEQEKEMALMKKKLLQPNDSN